MSGALAFVGKHPVMIAAGIFVVGAIFLLMRRPTVVDNGMGAFYAAQAASANSGNELASVQAQIAGATAIATIAAGRDIALADKAASYNAQINTVQAQHDVSLANINAGVLMQAEDTRQQAQKQQYWLGVKQEQILDKISPYIMNQPNGPSIIAALARANVPYIPAH